MTCAKRYAPNLEVHVSTQHSSTNSSAANYWKRKGMDRVVLAREVTLEEIKQTAKHTEIPLEVDVYKRQVLGYLLFSFLFGAIGAMCSKVEEVNGATMPIQLFIIAVFIISFISLQNPDTLFAKALCYIPFTSWMCMFINVAMGSVSVVEILISLLLLAITTIATGILGARLYRRGTLTYGNSVKFSNIVKMLKKKE